VRPHLVARQRRRLAREEGFTLVEMIITLLILGILISIVVPSYLTFKDRASKTAAKTAIGEAVRSVASYGADNFPGGPNDPNAVASTSDSGYSGISLGLLNAKYDASLSTVPGAPYVIDPVGWNGNTTSPIDFCLTAAVGRWIAVKHGIDGPTNVGTVFTPGTCTVS
jgi:prepilin-type N-terminal cleavage/methylation domain-containing protein